MQTRLTPAHQQTESGQRAEAILRKCVHCGFCNATCPTYRLVGDELDGPRGRIYQIKRVLEGEAPTRLTQTHLDRCLTCRNCETTCPAGVEYAELLEIGRELVEQQVRRPWTERLQRRLLRDGLVSPLFAPALKLGRLLRPWLPKSLAQHIPRPNPYRTHTLRTATADRATGINPPAPATPSMAKTEKPAASGLTPPALAPQRQVWLLAGCVQAHLSPGINAAAQRVLQHCGVVAKEAPDAGCCGALALHLSDKDKALAQARRNIDTWWPAIETDQVESLLMTASGCGTTVKEYGRLLAHDPAYAQRAARISALTRDLGEWAPQLVQRLPSQPLKGLQLLVQTPCSLMHGQQLPQVLTSALQQLGASVRTALQDDQQCCGAAGTYAVLQPEMAQRLRDRKLSALAPSPQEIIVSANMACIQHLQAGTSRPVQHWIEVLAARLS